jgi:protein-L-isoaspartate(D-aspartate) O-methyltransferase
MTDKYGLRERGLADERVLAAMERVPREAFVPPEYLAQALEDHPLPIGQGQTISQPYMVAAMSELLHLTPASRVLEIGTGSGFQTAVLAELAAEVYSVEILPELQSAARARLARLGYRNIRFRLGDGYDGWAEFAPYDGNLVTSAPEHVPPPLKAQLADGARLIHPRGARRRRPDSLAGAARWRALRGPPADVGGLCPLHGAPRRTPLLGS